MRIEEAIKQKDTRVIDVRTPQEFSGGHVAGSVNIPLNEIPQKLELLKQENTPIILCCASGMRSSQATQFLLANGFSNVFNGGSWFDVNYLMNK